MATFLETLGLDNLKDWLLTCSWGRTWLDGDWSFDCLMVKVINQAEVFVLEPEDVFAVSDFDSWGRVRNSAELGLHLLSVVSVQVHITKSENELAWSKTRHLGKHEEQQRIAGDVEGHSQEIVGTALVEVQAKFSRGGNEALKQAVARR